MTKIGMVGVGYWGPNILRNLCEFDNSQVVSVCDTNPKKLESIRKQRIYHGINTTTNLDDIINDGSIEAVVIATPTATHYPITKAALEHGKHVLVEKPLTIEPAQSYELAKLADEKSKILLVGHVFLYNSIVRRMKEEIDKGTIGSITYINAIRKGLGPIRQDVNALWDLAPHDVSIFNYLIGSQPEWVSATGCIQQDKPLASRDNVIEDVVMATFGYPHGVVGYMMTSWIDPIKQREVTVVGTKTMLKFDDIERELVIFEKGVDYQPSPEGGFGEFQASIRDGNIIKPNIKYLQPLTEECKHFLECIQQGKKPFTNARDAYMIVSALSAAQTSLKNGGIKVPIMYHPEVMYAK